MKQKQTRDYIYFSELAYEFDSTDFPEVEKKIKRRLEYYKLSSYNQERVDYIRRLKNEVYREISHQSKYYNKSESDYADLADFDIERMTSDFLENYPDLTELDMTRILNLAIYLNYLR